MGGNQWLNYVELHFFLEPSIKRTGKGGWQSSHEIGRFWRICSQHESLKHSNLFIGSAGKKWLFSKLGPSDMCMSQKHVLLYDLQFFVNFLKPTSNFESQDLLSKVLTLRLCLGNTPPVKAKKGPKSCNLRGALSGCNCRAGLKQLCRAQITATPHSASKKLNKEQPQQPLKGAARP